MFLLRQVDIKHLTTSKATTPRIPFVLHKAWIRDKRITIILNSKQNNIDTGFVTGYSCNHEMASQQEEAEEEKE